MALANSRALRVTIGVVVLLAISVGAWFLMRGPHDEFATLSGHRSGTFALVLAPNGTEVASGGGDGTVYIWDLATKRPRQTLVGHTDRVTALAYSPDGNTLASAGADKTLCLWDTRTGEKKQSRQKLPGRIANLAYSSDGKILAAALDRVVFYWDSEIYNDPRKVAPAHTMYISGMAFIPGKHELATFSADKTVRFWNLDTGKMTGEMPGPTGHCHGLAVSADGKLLACIGGGRAHLFDLDERKPIEAIEPNARTLYGVAFSPDKRLLAVGSEDKVIVIWDIAGKRERARLRGHDFTVGPMAFLPDSQTLITSSHDSTLKMWKVP